MRILLTGAGGMLGRNVLEHVRARDYEWLNPTRAQLDLRKSEDVLRYVEKNKPDFVIHAAGIVGGIQANIKEPVRFFIDNLDIGRNVIMSARRVGVTRMLNLSCSCMYPRSTAMPMRETSILTGELEPTNEGYALARIAAQRLCEYISKEDSRFRYKTLVSCNLYGRYDKFDPAHAHMIPAVIVKLQQAKLKELPQIDIWGDGTATREFMYAGDFADCILSAVENFESLPELANVGLGSEVSINEYYEKIAKCLGYQGTFFHDLSKPSGMSRKVVDPSRIHDWGWKASTSLEDGLKATCEFFLQDQNSGT